MTEPASLALLTSHADAAWAALEGANVELDATPRWHWFKRKRLFDEIERRLAEAETLERKRRQTIGRMTW